MLRKLRNFFREIIRKIREIINRVLSILVFMRRLIITEEELGYELLISTSDLIQLIENACKGDCKHIYIGGHIVDTKLLDEFLEKMREKQDLKLSIIINRVLENEITLKEVLEKHKSPHASIIHWKFMNTNLLLLVRNNEDMTCFIIFNNLTHNEKERENIIIKITDMNVNECIREVLESVIDNKKINTSKIAQLLKNREVFIFGLQNIEFLINKLLQHINEEINVRIVAFESDLSIIHYILRKISRKVRVKNVKILQSVTRPLKAHHITRYFGKMPFPGDIKTVNTIPFRGLIFNEDIALLISRNFTLESCYSKFGLGIIIRERKYVRKLLEFFESYWQSGKETKDTETLRESKAKTPELPSSRTHYPSKTVQLRTYVYLSSSSRRKGTVKILKNRLTKLKKFLSNLSVNPDDIYININGERLTIEHSEYSIPMQYETLTISVPKLPPNCEILSLICDRIYSRDNKKQRCKAIAESIISHNVNGEELQIPLFKKEKLFRYRIIVEIMIKEENIERGIKWVIYIPKVKLRITQPRSSKISLKNFKENGLVIKWAISVPSEIRKKLKYKIRVFKISNQCRKRELLEKEVCENKCILTHDDLLCNEISEKEELKVHLVGLYLIQITALYGNEEILKESSKIIAITNDRSDNWANEFIKMSSEIVDANDRGGSKKISDGRITIHYLHREVIGARLKLEIIPKCGFRIKNIKLYKPGEKDRQIIFKVDGPKPKHPISITLRELIPENRKGLSYIIVEIELTKGKVAARIKKVVYCMVKEYLVYIGKLPTPYYASIAETLLKHTNRVILKARGRHICKAVDIANIIKYNLCNGKSILTIEPRIYTEKLDKRRVSAIEIEIKRTKN